MTHRLPLVAAASLAVAATLVAQAPQTPVFRAGVDLVTVDVVVVQADGSQVTGLGPADFAVSLDGRARRVVTAQYVSAIPRRTPSAAAPPLPQIPGPSSNVARPVSRSFLFLIDTDQISSGQGRGATKAISTFVDRLGPDDRVGLVSMPTGTPRVELSPDRAPLKAALEKITGVSIQRRECGPTMGEAAGYGARDDRAVAAYYARASSIRGCSPSEFRLRTTLAQHRLGARALLDAGAAMASAMTAIEGPKTLVLVSEGLLADDELRDELRAFGTKLERARVALYAIQLDAPLAEAAIQAKSQDTARFDEQYGFYGMTDAAAAARGTAVKTLTDPGAVLDRIAREASGYYLIGFEGDSTDRESKAMRLAVKVNRQGADVRVREFVTIEKAAASAAPARPADARALVGELLRAPVPVAGLAVDLDAFSSPPVAAGGKAPVVLVAEVGGAAPLRAIGYEIADRAGKVVEDDFVESPTTVALAGGGYAYLVRVDLAAGDYRLRLAAVDGAGTRGSGEHRFAVGAQAAGDIRVGDLIFGDDSSGALRPVSRVAPSLPRLVMRLDLEGPASAFADVRVRFRVRLRGVDAAPGQEALLTLRDGGRPTRRVVATAVDVSSMPSGPYEALVTVVTPKGEVTVSRAFTVPAAAR